MVVAGALVLAACSSSNDAPAPVPPPETGTVQILHASPDAPTVDVLVNGGVVLANVDYRDASAFINLEVGTYEFEIQANLPGGAKATVLGPAMFPIAADTIYTLAAVGRVADQTLALETDWSQPRTDVASGQARLFVLHAARGPEEDGSLPVDVYLTAPDAELANPLPTFDFGDTLGPVEVDPGLYQIRITLGGTDTIVYDSGEIELTADSDLRIAAVPNTVGGPAAVSLVGIAPTGSLDLFDFRTQTAVRVAHLSAATGAVDVLVNGEIFAGLDNVTFPAVTGFIPVPGDTYTVAVTDGENPGAVAIGPVDLTLAAGSWYSVLAVNSPVEPLIIEQKAARPVATAAQVRIVHAAANPAAASVDIYVLSSPEGLELDITDVDPTLPGIPFKAETGYLYLAADTYYVAVTPAGTKDVVISVVLPALETGDVATAIARDPAGEGGFDLEVRFDNIDD
jgi:archaellum component FlaF (FlaF/FlaG flagellin family)